MRHVVPEGWMWRPLWSMFHRAKNVGHPREPMLSVFREHGVVLKESLANNNVTADNRDIYQLVEPGWLIVNRMKAWQGSVGVSALRGIVSGHYICFRPTHSENARYLDWLLRSDVYATRFASLSRGVRPGQAEIDNDELRTLPILRPPPAEQQRIADFLDDQVARLDAIAAARREQGVLVQEQFASWLESMLLLGEEGLLPVKALTSMITSGPRGWGDFVGENGWPFLRTETSLALASTSTERTSPTWTRLRGKSVSAPGLARATCLCQSLPSSDR